MVRTPAREVVVAALVIHQEAVADSTVAAVVAEEAEEAVSEHIKIESYH